MTGPIQPAFVAPEGGVAVEFCGEWHQVDAARPFAIGRDADLVVDDNPFLHRRLLEIEFSGGLWVLSNVGSRLAVTVSDGAGRMQSWLAPGGRLPLVFEHTVVVFSAGQTTYDLSIHLAEPVFDQVEPASPDGQTTVGVLAFTPSQKLLMLALAEPVLQLDGTGMSDIPTSARAAERLGWALTRFNRKLDNVCDKLDRAGVKGLRGRIDDHAMNRRARLVEYAIAARLVTRADLPMLDNPEELS